MCVFFCTANVPDDFIPDNDDCGEPGCMMYCCEGVDPNYVHDYGKSLYTVSFPCC